MALPSTGTSTLLLQTGSVSGPNIPKLVGSLSPESAPSQLLSPADLEAVLKPLGPREFDSFLYTHTCCVTKARQFCLSNISSPFPSFHRYS